MGRRGERTGAQRTYLGTGVVAGSAGSMATNCIALDLPVAVCRRSVSESRPSHRPLPSRAAVCPSRNPRLEAGQSRSGVSPLSSRPKAARTPLLPCPQSLHRLLRNHAAARAANIPDRMRPSG